MAQLLMTSGTDVTSAADVAHGSSAEDKVEK